MLLKFGIVRHEQITDRIVAERRQFDALCGHVLAEQPVRNLDKKTGAVAHQRIGADRATVGQVLEHLQTITDDLVRAHALHVDDESDAAGIMFLERVVQAVLRGQRRCLARGAGPRGALVPEHCNRMISKAGSHCRTLLVVRRALIHRAACVAPGVPRFGGSPGNARRAKWPFPS